MAAKPDGTKRARPDPSQHPATSKATRKYSSSTPTTGDKESPRRLIGWCTNTTWATMRRRKMENWCSQKCSTKHSLDNVAHQPHSSILLLVNQENYQLVVRVLQMIIKTRVLWNTMIIHPLCHIARIRTEKANPRWSRISSSVAMDHRLFSWLQVQAKANEATVLVINYYYYVYVVSCYTLKSLSYRENDLYSQ